MIYTPRLKEKYYKEIIPNFKSKYNLKNDYQVPILNKICINQGIGFAMQDKKIIEICQEFFDLNQLNNSTIINQDAYLLAKNKKSFRKRFDVIIVDIFTGKEEFGSEINKEFIKDISHFLKNDGVAIFNRLGHKKLLREETKKLETFLTYLFKKTEKIFIKDPRGYQNELVIAKEIKIA